MDRATVCLRYRSFNPKRLKPPARLFADARRPTTAPKPMVDIKHIRQNLELYERTCIERNYKRQAGHASKISQLHGRWQELQRQGRSMRERSNLLRKLIANPATSHDGDEPGEMRNMTREQALEEARRIKDNIAGIEKGEAETVAEMEALALEMPNLTDEATPRGAEPALLRYINEPPKGFEEGPKSKVWRSHIHIGTELGLLDLAAAAKASGWGWYYLLGEAAQLEQALVQYALAVARRRGWTQVSPPSLVYSHIGAACGFQPRDQHGEQQIYTIAQSRVDADRGVPQRCLAGTSEIALAGMEANATLDAEALPLRRVAVSRCFRAEAGARGKDTKGLYRVHEFTKVELFAWTAPDLDCARALLDDMVDMQVEILAGLGLYCRVLAMPVADLGASATHKIDIEAYFPSRRHLHGGWGELTSASLCTDYQTRRLATRTRIAGRLVFPYSANATGLAVPRVLAALFEYGWNEVSATVAVPPCLRLWMDGKTSIGSRNKSALSSSPSPALGSST